MEIEKPKPYFAPSDINKVKDEQPSGVEAAMIKSINLSMADKETQVAAQTKTEPLPEQIKPEINKEEPEK
jgi:hypothetical protein